MFLDLNGTLVLPLKPDRLSDLEVIPGTPEAVARLSAAGFVCPVVTVQSRISKGYFSTDEFEEWFTRFSEHLKQQGALVVGPYICPHRFAEPCACKKPNTLLYDRASINLGIVQPDSFVIGDSPDDIRAANRMGAKGCLVRTGWASDPGVAAEVTPDMTGDTITECVDWILRHASVD